MDVKDIINVFRWTSFDHNGEEFTIIDRTDKYIYSEQEKTYIAEAELLKHIGFQIHVNLPYGLAINYLQLLMLVSDAKIVQRVWNYINDSLRTSLHCIHPPPTIACMAIYMAARYEDVALPKDWMALFDVEKVDVVSCAAWMGTFYCEEEEREKARRNGIELGVSTGKVIPLSLQGLEDLLRERRKMTYVT